MKRIVMKIFIASFALLITLNAFSQEKTIYVDGNSQGRIFEGIGAVSAGASTRLLFDYDEPYRSDVNDFLFKPKFGASFQHLKVEIGGGENSTCGSEPSHAIVREELKNPVNRGYELWFLSEAKKRNQDIILDCLPWSYPYWLSGKFSQDAADWFVSFLDAADKYYGIKLDWVSAAQNEMGTNRDWIVHKLRPALDENGYDYIKLQAPDDDSEHWQIIPHLQQDSVYNSLISAVGYHYLNGREPWTINQESGRDATWAAKNSGKSLWASEEWGSGKDWEGVGAMFMARLMNKYYIRDKVVKTQIWSPVDGIYKGLPWENSGAMSADEPWSGHYKVWPQIWAIAHTTQFADPGWKYLDSGCGQLSDDNKNWKGSYVTFKNPTTMDWSMVVCTDSVTTINVLLENDVKSGPVYVWHSDSIEQFICVDTIQIMGNSFSYELKNISIYSFTTTTGQKKGHKVIPESKSFPFPYRDTYDNYQPGDIPKYHTDQKGSFEIADIPGHGLCLKQILPQQGYLWYWRLNEEIKPYTVLGDADWTDYSISADVFIAGGNVEIGGRFEDQYKLTYGLVLEDSGAWELKYKDDVLASGIIKKFNNSKWYNIRLDMHGENIIAYINGKKLVSILDKSRDSGMAYLASTYNPNCFDNLSVSPINQKLKN